MIKFRAEGDMVLETRPAKIAMEQLKDREMIGWMKPGPSKKELKQIKEFAAKINQDSDYLVCIGIGGSYLGHKAVIDALDGTYDKRRTKILYAGNSLSSYQIQQVLDEIEDHDFSINVISKSGTTTEPAVAFRIFKQKLIEKYGAEEAADRIYATTDARKGALHDEAEAKEYHTLVVPDNVGGRFSVLTAVGLLPIAVAGIDIDELLAGAKTLEAHRFKDISPELLKYTLVRTKFADFVYTTEILATFEPRLQTFAEWWKQLFGESEGKDHRGILPASVVYTTDLHSLGQYLQEGRRNIFETVIRIENPDENSLKVPTQPDNPDGLKYLENRTLTEINTKAEEATIEAHREGGIPVLELVMPDLSARSLGALIYYFELSCALSVTLQGLNPFDQPGVEAYKKNMFHLLGKPGC